MSKLSILLSVFATELVRFEDDTKAVLTELHPQSAETMLDEWEDTYGLPRDPALSTTARRQRLRAKMIAIGGQSAEYFYTLSDALGYNRYLLSPEPFIQIVDTVFLPFRLGISKVGDRLYSLTTGPTVFSWKVIGTDVETDTALVSLFNQCKPAHTEIIFENA